METLSIASDEEDNEAHDDGNDEAMISSDSHEPLKSQPESDNKNNFDDNHSAKIECFPVSLPVDPTPLEENERKNAPHQTELVDSMRLPDLRNFENGMIVGSDKKLFKNDLFQKITRKRRGKTRISSKLLNNDEKGDGIFRGDDDGVMINDDEGQGIALTTTIRADANATDDGDSVTTGTWSIEDENSGQSNLKRYNSRQRRPKADSGVRMSAADIAICQQLDAEYDRALEERDVTFTARYQSVRQSACLSIVSMALFILLGTLFFERQAPDWGIGKFSWHKRFVTLE